MSRRYTFSLPLRLRRCVVGLLHLTNASKLYRRPLGRPENDCFVTLVCYIFSVISPVLTSALGGGHIRAPAALLKVEPPEPVG
jgi:hypothetical protein